MPLQTILAVLTVVAACTLPGLGLAIVLEWKVGARLTLDSPH